MAKVEYSVEELVSMMEKGELSLPEMQRGYVWQATRVRDLLDSLYRGYPSGTILIWETDTSVPTRKMALDQVASEYKSIKLLLDGQQRLTSLAAVIRGREISVRGRKRPIDLLFNLEHPDTLSVVTEVHENSPDDERIEDEADSSEKELLQRFNRMTFVVSTKKLAQRSKWVKVSDVFNIDSDAPFLKKANVTNLDDPNFVRYTQRLARLRAIRKYAYHIDLLGQSLDYDEVTEIFVRVNSLGSKLRGSDLALAQITAKWQNSLTKFEQFQRNCSKLGFNLDLSSVHIRNLVVFATGQCRFRTLARLTATELESAWSKCKRGMEFALDFMASNVEVESPTLLASPYILITIAYFGYRRNYSLSTEEEEQLRRWILLANIHGRYSRGSSETFLDQDLSTLRDDKGVVELMERLRVQVGRLRLTPRDLESRNQNSAIFKTMFLAFRAAGAKDWLSKIGITINPKRASNKLEYHHIFPKFVLGNRYSTREINDIANLCFISGKTNRRISKREPEEYFRELINTAGIDQFEAQCIPTDERIRSVNMYSSFLNKRRSMIAEKLNVFLEIGDLETASK